MNSKKPLVPLLITITDGFDIVYVDICSLYTQLTDSNLLVQPISKNDWLFSLVILFSYYKKIQNEL